MSWSSQPFASGGSFADSPQAQQFFARVAGMSSFDKANYTAFISTLVAAGIWSAGDVLLLLGGPSQATGLTNLLSASYTATVNGSMTFAPFRGFTGDGATGYINTNFIPATANGNFQLNSASHAVLTLSNRTSTGTLAQMGTNFGGTPFSGLLPLWDAGGTYGHINFNNFGLSSATPATTQGMWATTTNATTRCLFNNGRFLNSNLLTPFGLDTSSFLVNAAWIGASPGLFTPDQNGVVFIGGYLTPQQIAILSNAANTFFAAYGANTYPVTSSYPAISSAALSPIFSGASTLPLLGVNTHVSVDDVGAPISPAQNASMAAAVGAKVVRIDAVNWQTVEPAGGGSYVFPNDATISALRTAGITVQLALVYSNTNYESSIYTGPTDSPGIAAYAAYCAAVVSHHGATGFIYEIGNEWNISNGAGQYSWAPAASPSAAATLTNAAVTAMIAANAAVVIISGGLSPGAGSGYIAPNTFIATFAADATLTHVAGLGFHPYDSGVQNGLLPEQLIADTASFASASGTAKPIYLSEDGYQNGADVNSEQQKAVYDARILLASIVAQVPEICLYVLCSAAGWGLFDGSQNALPAAGAMKAVTLACSGMVTNDAAESAAATFFKVTIHKASSHIAILWAEYGAWTYTQTEASIATASAVDLFGNPVPVSIVGNTWSCNVVDVAGPVIVTVT